MDFHKYQSVSINVAINATVWSCLSNVEKKKTPEIDDF